MFVLINSVLTDSSAHLEAHLAELLLSLTGYTIPLNSDE